MSIQIQLQNIDRIIEAYKKYPLQSKIALTEAIQKGATLVQRNARMGAPVGVSGLLRSQINISYGELRGTISANSQYALFVEEGTKPHWVPIAALQPWADLKGIPVYALQKSIAKVGTKAQPFMEKAAQQSTEQIQVYFNEAVATVLNEMIV